MTVVINLLGGPGVGKSTTATGVFSYLKQRNISIEYCNEYAKDVVYEETLALLENQIHIFAEQFRRQYRLLNKVSYIVTDSPLILSPVYFQYWFDKSPKNNLFDEAYCNIAKNYFVETFNRFDNVNWLIHRKKKYVAEGRTQTEEEAKEIDTDVEGCLREYGQSFGNTDSQNAIMDVCNDILRREGKSPGYIRR
jgi:hypothetical protein